MKATARKILQLREKRGLTQDGFAEKCGLSRSTIARYEAGVVTPSFDTLQRIAEAFNVSADYFFDKTDNNKTLNDDDIKFAVFGDPDVTDAQFEEIKKIARIIRERDKK